MSKKLLIIFMVIVLAGLGIFFMRGGKLDNVPALFSTFSKNSDNNADKDAKTENTAHAGDWEKYEDPAYGFHFEYPKGLNVSSFSEDTGDTILIQGQISSAEGASSESQNTQSQSTGFQIFVSPFDELVDETPKAPGPITKERILDDIPDMKITGEQTVMLERDKSISALIFFSEDDIGKTREVWFVHEGYLYQVTAAPGFDEILSQIMATFGFK